MSRLPSVGGDDNEWGVILNDYLSVSLDTDGTLKTAALPSASATASGIVELATTAEATTGTDTVRAVTPAGLKTVADTKANTTHAHAGTDITSGIISATYLPTSSATTLGIVELATTAEATTGTDTVRAVTPAGLKTVADTKVTGQGVTKIELVTVVPDPGDQVAGTLYVVEGTSSGGGTSDPATTTTAGIVELATNSETTAGTDTTRAVTPAGVKAVADTKANLVHAHSGADITSGTVSSTYLPAASATATGVVELATVAETTTGTDTTRAVTPAGLDAALIIGPGPVTLTDGATINTDASLGNYFRVSISGARTFAAPTNPTDGQRAMWEITCTSSNRVVTMTTGTSGSFKFGSDFTNIPTVNLNTTTFIGAVYRSSSSRWHILSVGSGH